MPAGRPSEYKPEYCDVVIECGRRGESFAGMSCACDTSKQTMALWMKQNPEFLNSMENARTLSQLWWEKVGQDHIVECPDGNKVNAGLYSRSMAARFPDDWRENNKVEINATISRPTEEDEKILARWYESKKLEETKQLEKS